MSSQDDFFSEMPSFDSFNSVSKLVNYSQVPESWLIWIADIKGSTKAIEAGRYKEVNLLGAACIAAATNTLKDKEIPYIFGGDGATLLTPAKDFDVLKDAMSQLILLADQGFNLELRVGAVPVEVLLFAGHPIFLAKHRLTSGKYLSAISGGGISYAEKLIKTEGNKFVIEKAKNRNRDMLEGLSCRWQPIQARNGVITTLIIASPNVDDSDLIYPHILSGLENILEAELASANPLLNEKKYYDGFFKNFKSDLKLSKKVFSIKTFKRMMGSVLAFLIFKWKFKFILSEMQRYEQSLAYHSDFQKFEGCVKMTLDCTPDQVDKIEAFLNEELQMGKIFYGIQKSSSTLMTCFVASTDEGQHIHFVDASDGGYTLAAKGMKAQMKAAAQ